MSRTSKDASNTSPSDSNLEMGEGAFLKARLGSRPARWRVLADCRDYLRFVVRQGNWSKSPGVPGTSDLVQRTIVDAWQKFSGFRGCNDRQLRGWVKAILINAARNDRREAMPADPDPDRRLAELSDGRPLPDQAAIDSERMMRIDAALSAVEERDRRVIRLRVWHGLSFAEIGRRLGISEDAARMQFARSLDRLRKQMRSLNGLR